MTGLLQGLLKFFGSEAILTHQVLNIMHATLSSLVPLHMIYQKGLIILQVQHIVLVLS